jgi:retinoid hydroxylase
MQETQEKKQLLPLPPGNLGLPIIGETISFFRDRNFAKKRQQKYGSIFKTNILGRPTIYLSGAEANRFIFSNENNFFAIAFPRSTRILLGDKSLSTNTGNFHTSRRKLIYQAFQPRALANYIPTMERFTSKYLEKWQRMGTLTWYPELRNYTFDIASTLLVGVDGGSDTKLCQLFEDWCAGLFSIPMPLP